VAQRAPLGLAALRPGLAALDQFVLDALRPVGAAAILEPLELAQRREQRPRALAGEPQVPGAASRLLGVMRPSRPG
jgi:hypothetical protein